MSKIYQSITALIGNTPMVELKSYAEEHGCKATLLAKLEFFNPAGSIKDRAAAAMILDAEKKGELKKGGSVIEATSGNTGIALACICAARGYGLTITMPDTMSAERISLLRSYGAKVILTDGKKGMTGAIEKANELNEKANAFMPKQFENPQNPQSHFDTTGPEIWRDTQGQVDILVCGIGTGGTISGAGAFLKTKNPKIEIVGVEPKLSAVLSGESAGKHGIQGIGAGFVPKTLNTHIYNNRIEKISDEEAFAAAKTVARLDGILAGISSGAALAAATRLAQKTENIQKTIVVIFPDGGERYLSVMDSHNDH